MAPHRKGGLEEWPADRPLPRFASHEEEDRFWSSHEFGADADPAGWEAVDGPAVLWTPTGAAMTSLLRIDFDVCPVGQPDKYITVRGAIVDTGAMRVMVPPETFDVITLAIDNEIGEIHGGAEARYLIGPCTLVYHQGKRRTLDVARGEPGGEPIFGAMGLEAFGLVLDPGAIGTDRRLRFRGTRRR